jgi:hypothetical protein
MLRSLNTLVGYTIHAFDGPVGRVETFFCDDATWIVRYAVVDTGEWLQSRRVLLTMASFDAIDELSREMRVDRLTREQVRNSPDIDLAQPVSRQHQIELHTYYGWAEYWAISEDQQIEGLLNSVPEIAEDAPPPEEEARDPHLRNVTEIEDYTVQALDGEIGPIESLTVDDTDWVIQQLVVDGETVASGKKFAIPTTVIQQVEWAEAMVYADVLLEDLTSDQAFEASSASMS